MLFQGVCNVGHNGSLFFRLRRRDRRCMQEVRLVAASRLRLCWQRVCLSRIPDMAEGNRESGLAGVQSVEVADGALRLYGNVVSVI